VVRRDEHLATQRQQQLQQGLEYLRKAIPRFDADTVSGLRNYAVGEGFTSPEVESINDPRLVKLMWKAQQYDTLKASQKSAVEAVQKAPPMIKPGSTANQQTRATVRVKQATDRLKRTGSVDAFADALLARGFK
jgi:broad specificity polyphosphatase/5'/3'-nucleotidase SurE